MKNFFLLIFLKNILTNSVNIFSIFGFLVFIVTVFIPIPNNIKSNILIAAAAFSILSASYFTWKKSYSLIPQLGDLFYQIVKVSFDSPGPWTQGLPLDKLE